MGFVVDPLTSRRGSATLVGTGSSSAANPISITIPAGTEENDLCLYACQTTNTVPDVLGPEDSGWTEIYRNDKSSDEWQSAWYKLATSTDETNAGTGTWDWDMDATNCAGVVAVYRGVSTLAGFASKSESMTTSSVVTPPGGLLVALFSTLNADLFQGDPGASISKDVGVRGGANNNQIWLGHRNVGIREGWSVSVSGQLSGVFTTSYVLVFD